MQLRGSSSSSSSSRKPKRNSFATKQLLPVCFGVLVASGLFWMEHSALSPPSPMGQISLDARAGMAVFETEHDSDEKDDGCHPGADTPILLPDRERNQRKHRKHHLGIELPHPNAGAVVMGPTKQEESPKNPPFLRNAPNKTKKFFHKYCQKKTRPLFQEQEWWPELSNETASTNQNGWQLRTPQFLLAGAKKAGTTALYSWLIQHQLIVPPKTKELLFFMPRRFPPEYWLKHPSHKVQVDDVRMDLYSKDRYPISRLKHHPMTRTFEATPDYLLFSTLSRIPILCTMPWIKLLVVLRDPIDRTFSNYNFLQDHQRKRNSAQKPNRANPLSAIEKMSFEDYVDHDLRQLHQAEVLSVSSLQSSFNQSQPASSKQEERKAWRNYQQAIGKSPNSAVGRSLYVLQLEEWYDALREMGRDPSTEILVVRNEDMRMRPEETLKKIFDWLGLDPSIAATAAYLERMVTDYNGTELSDITRRKLAKLYAPYNERLYRLLGWDEDMQWDPTTVTSTN